MITIADVLMTLWIAVCKNSDQIVMRNMWKFEHHSEVTIKSEDNSLLTLQLSARIVEIRYFIHILNYLYTTIQ